MPEMRDIPGFEGRYAVTEDGRVWSYPKRRRPRGGWLKSSCNLDGYRFVNLTRVENGGYRSYLVSRLVLTTFVGPGEGMDADHINNVRTDDRLENLRWLSHQENVARIWEQGRRNAKGEANSRHFLTEETVRAIRGVRQTGLSYKKIAEQFNIRKGHVADICTRRIWSHI